jgi:uncharacterized LabA/DUF88 family protein
MNALRAHYYTSVGGDIQAQEKVREALWQIGFAPAVFKKDTQSKKSKGVDIALARDMLAHAFRDNYDAAVLVAGDGDYLPLLEEVRRLGKLIHIVFFRSSGLNDSLRLEADIFHDLAALFLDRWRSYQG